MYTGQVLLKPNHRNGGLELPRLGRLCIYVVFCNVLLPHNVFVLAKPNLSVSASGEKSIDQLSSLDLTFDPRSGSQTSASQIKRSADEAATIASKTSSSNDAAGHGDEMTIEHTKASEGDQGAEHNYESQYTLSHINFSRVEIPFVIGIWILSAIIAKIVFYMAPKLSSIFPESFLLIVIGFLIGGLLRQAANLRVPSLTPNTFFFYMLPPIILNAVYLIPNRKFFENITTIFLIGVIGTIFNIATIGSSLYACGQAGIFGVDLPFLHIFLFSTLIAAVDPVSVLTVFGNIQDNELLHIVVFGEMLLSYAVTIIMYHMFNLYNEFGADEIMTSDVVAGVRSFFVHVLGGCFTGVVWGFLTGLVTRCTKHVRVIEPIFIFVMAYLAYLNAEMFHTSGVLAITFCGITMKNYIEQNVSPKSRTTIEYTLKIMSFSAETIIFMFLGVITISYQHVWNTWFVLLTIIFCLVYRTLSVLILSAVVNCFRTEKLTRADQFVMSYGGLRGAVAFMLVLLVDQDHIPLQPMFLTTTIAVVYFTMFLQGITIKPVVKILDGERFNQHKPINEENCHEMDTPNKKMMNESASKHRTKRRTLSV